MTDIQVIFNGITEQLNQAFLDRGWVDFVVAHITPTNDPHWYWRFEPPSLEDKAPIYTATKAIIEDGCLNCNVGPAQNSYELADPKFPQNLIQDLIKYLDRFWINQQSRHATIYHE
jgi:hypothetical protein